MAGWRDLHDAPRDRPVWLFLPASKFDSDANGRPFNVEHEIVVGWWSVELSSWLVGRREVYPSMWSDADPAGPSPDNPVLKAF